MANFITPPKAGSAWTDVQLNAFNIQMEKQTCAEFFGISQLPPPKVQDAILTTTTADFAAALNDQETLEFLIYLENAMRPRAYGSEVANFAVALLRLMGYNRYGSVVKFNVDLPLRMCNSDLHAQTDVCIMTRSDILLVVQEDKQACRWDDTLPVGQLVAECIAAFQNNNQRRDERGMELLSDYLMPGIIMRGTTPYFYKMKVTQDLVHSVENGKRPSQPTKIYQLKSVFPSGIDYGMAPLPNRRMAFQYYEAFKMFVFQTQPE